jgi:hypothetical protein
MDWRDEKKCFIHLSKDNNKDDLYFYEVIVHTGARHAANTDSRVFMNLVGTIDETTNRRFESAHEKMKVFQRGSVNTFVLAVKKLYFIFESYIIFVGQNGIHRKIREIQLKNRDIQK